MSQDTPIRESRVGRQLTRAIFGTSALVSTMTCLVLIAAEVHHQSEDTDHAIDNLAGTLAINLDDSIHDDDSALATRVLFSASAVPEVITIAAYRQDGRRFAAYTTADALPPAYFDATEPDFRQGLQGQRYVAFRDILQHGKPWGTMIVHWDLSDLWTRLVGIFLLTLALIGLARLISRPLAQRLQDQVGSPLEHLAQEARNLSPLSREDSSAGDDTVDELLVLRHALESMSRMHVAVAAVDDNAVEIDQISRSLRQVSHEMRSDGQTGQRAADESSKAISRFTQTSLQISQAVERLTDRYRESTVAIHATGESIAEISNQIHELAGSIERVSIGTHQSAASAHQISVAMKGVRDATHRVSDLASRFTKAVGDVERHASETASLSELSNHFAEKGAQAVGQTVDAMREVDDSFGEVSATVGDLAHRCTEIGESLVVIESLADETKLLALNAAIIAAQSGEYGRSFAVVAEGIRTLSERSIESARVIQDSLEDLQRSADQATKTVDEGGDKVAQGVACSAEATEVLRQILEATSQAADQMQLVSESTQNQTRDIAIVKKGLVAVGTLIDESSHAAGEQERVGREMAQAMVTMNQASKTIATLLGRQTHQAGILSDATGEVSAELDAIRAGTEEQETEGTRLCEQLEVFGDTTRATSRRAQSVHDLVEVLVAQASRLRENVTGDGDNEPRGATLQPDDEGEPSDG